MLKPSREIKTAVLVISGIFLFFFIFNYLKGENLLDPSVRITTIFENVEGLNTSSLVTLNGHKIGKVSSIEFTEDNSGKLAVLLFVNSSFKFSKNSRAELYENGLIGGKSIAILPAFDKATPAISGDTLISQTKPGLTELVNQRLTPLQEKIEKMMVSADVLINNLNDVFDVQSKENLKISIAELSETIKSLKNTSDSVNEFITDEQSDLALTLSNFNHITSDLKEVSAELNTVNYKSTFERLEATLTNFNSVLAAVENGEGSVGKLFKNDALYNNLENAAAQLNALLEDMKAHPKRYVHFSIFGKKETPKD